jgi:hypothetical protein
LARTAEDQIALLTGPAVRFTGRSKAQTQKRCLRKGLSEPVNYDDQLLASLFTLWEMLQYLEAMRQILIKHPGDTIGLKENAPKVKKSSETALRIAIEICQKVNAAIEKMKPLGEAEWDK